MTDPLGLIGSSGGVRPPTAGGASGGAPVGDGPSFSELLMKNIEQVNQLQQDANKAIEELAAGRRDDVAAVMIAKKKADIAFQTLLQVRNKVVDAYDELKQIRV